MDNKQRDLFNFWKLGFSAVYAALGFVVLYILGKSAWYETANQSWADWPRWIACIVFSMMGFSVLAILSTKTHKDDLNFPRSYIWKFPPTCFFLANFTFVLCQMNSATNGYLFVFIAYPISFLAGLFSESLIPALWAKAIEKAAG